MDGMTLHNASHEELINFALDYADENPTFNASFIHSLESDLDKYGELTPSQREGLENVIQKFKMLEK